MRFQNVDEPIYLPSLLRLYQTTDNRWNRCWYWRWASYRLQQLHAVQSFIHVNKLIIILPPPIIRHCVPRSSVRPTFVGPLTSISRHAIPLYLVEGFQWNLPQIMCREIAEKVPRSEGKGQGHIEMKCTSPAEGYQPAYARVWPSVRCPYGGGILIHGVVSRLTWFFLVCSLLTQNVEHVLCSVMQIQIVNI